MSNEIGQTYTKAKGSKFEGPQQVTLEALDASNSVFVVTDAERMASPISLTPRQWSEHYGGDPDFPESERAAILAQSVRQNREAIAGYGWPEGPDGGGRQSEQLTPEEQLKNAQKKK